MSGKLYGKYRGVVLDNIDPLRQGRILVDVPDVSGLAAGAWAVACVPIAGPQCGVYVAPEVGAGVWVEFERGDPDYPIWTGCWWASGAEVPASVATAPPDSPPIVLQTLGQQTLMLSDAAGSAGGILLQTASGAMISINETGVTIANGKGAIITLTGPTVDVNFGAWTVT